MSFNNQEGTILQDGNVSIIRNLSFLEVIYIFFLIFIAWLILRIFKKVFPWIAERVSGTKRLYVLALMPLFRIVVIIITILLLFPLILVPTTENLIAVLGAIGIAVGFAIKDYVSSILAGIVYLYEMPYQPGDWIEISGIYGEVKSIGLRTIELLTPDDTIVRIPQLKMWDTPFFNLSGGSKELQCKTNFFLQPKHNASQAKQILYDIAISSPYIQIKKPIDIIVVEKEFSTLYSIKAYPIDSRDQFKLITDLTIRGKTVLITKGFQFSNVPTLIKD